ncbi:MAG: S41 family peptidase [Chloroflexota bacterium]|nr:S41 family peptidase [Chloroflexota bacterium]
MPRILRVLTFFVLATILAVAAPQPAAGLARADGPVIALDQAAQVAPAQARPGPIVRQSFDLLMDRFVIPPESGAVLNGGLDGAEDLLQAKGIGHALTERPAWTNNRGDDWQLFLEAYNKIAEKAGEAISPIDLDRIVVAGMAASFDEGHTYYLPPEIFKEAQAQLTNQHRYAGIGVSMNRDLVVIEVFEGSPAEGAGLQVGDQLIAVEGESVEGKTTSETSSKVRGEPGTPVTLTIKREGVPDQISVTMTRAQISMDWIRARILDGNIGHLRIRTFPGPDALPLFNRAMERFSEAKVNGLIIDLRGNGGGSVATGEQVASKFIAENVPLYQQIDRRGGERTVTTWGERWDRDVPIAVLTDGGSGSMAEILAAALQENGIAKVFGVKTAGVVAGTSFHPLSDGSGLSVTFLIIKSGQGKVLNDVGLEPDQVVELDTAQLRRGHDNQLEAALAYVQAESAARANQQRAAVGAH